jgi:DNA segregation ATPase FtsK/SpoIIIE, S-DNA-T family
MRPLPENIDKLQDLIRNLNQDIQASQAKAKAYFEHGKANSQKLSQYFTPLLEANQRQLSSYLETVPTSTFAGWESDSWRQWDVTSAREETYIRIGDLIEPRTNGDFFIPAYIPFIGQGKTVIIRGGKDPALGAALLQSLVIRTALMLPHQSRYTLLDPAGAGIAFPMRRYLPLVQENSGDERRDLDQVSTNIQRIIETYLDASITSFERVPQEIRVNERFSFVFAADFPNQYDRRAIEGMQSVGNKGTAAGTYLFIHYNTNHELPRDISMDGFKNAFYVTIPSPKII